MAHVRSVEHATLPLTLKVYTKRAFYRAEWDEETVNARGHVYHGDKCISAPFPKFFNINENEHCQMDTVISTIEERINNGYQVYLDKKWNGHLSIVFGYDGEFHNHTKGSFFHDFNEHDREVIKTSGFSDDIFGCFPEGTTFMFEIISDNDPHLMTTRHMGELGGRAAVLLGINNSKGQSLYLHHYLPILIQAGFKNLNLINQLHRISIDEFSMNTGMNVRQIIEYLYEQEDTEGWIVHEPESDFRVKIKTKWFVRNRYLRQFNHEKTSKIFIELFDSPKAFDKIPEELHEKYRFTLQTYDIEKRYYESISEDPDYVYTKEEFVTKFNIALVK